ncbi:hypothetical protein [Qaidamihabitans albus]|uniref:hypothetical protein n=1 Tax=Qaidamihabitans albus TaxID=2795733 RepID=UPI0018F25800|nr:hypothetical protein [Qaidamihabitans albus]
MAATELTHQDCIKLIRSPERSRTGMVAVDGRDSVPLACFVLDNGDVLVPTGESRALLRAAAGCPVRVEFSHRDRDGHTAWTVTGTGLARPLHRRDQPRPFPHTTGALAMLQAFQNGIRVRVARLTGVRVTADPGGEIPDQRTARDARPGTGGVSGHRRTGTLAPGTGDVTLARSDT